MTLQVPNTEQWADLASRVSPNKTFYGTCNTVADVAEKAVTVPKFTSADLQTGVRVAITMTNEQSASGPITLNINDLGGVLINGGGWNAGDTIEFVYSGGVWAIIGATSGSFAPTDPNRYETGNRLFADTIISGVMDIEDTFTTKTVQTLALSQIDGVAQQGEVFSLRADNWEIQEHPFLKDLTLTFLGGDPNTVSSWDVSVIECPSDFDPGGMWLDMRGDQGGVANPRFSSTLVAGTMASPSGTQAKITSQAPLRVALYRNGTLVDDSEAPANVYDYVQLSNATLLTRQEISPENKWITYHLPYSVNTDFSTIWFASPYDGDESADGSMEKPFTQLWQIEQWGKIYAPEIIIQNDGVLRVKSQESMVTTDLTAGDWEHRWDHAPDTIRKKCSFSLYLRSEPFQLGWYINNYSFKDFTFYDSGVESLTQPLSEWGEQCSLAGIEVERDFVVKTTHSILCQPATWTMRSSFDVTTPRFTLSSDTYTPLLVGTSSAHEYNQYIPLMFEHVGAIGRTPSYTCYLRTGKDSARAESGTTYPDNIYLLSGDTAVLEFNPWQEAFNSNINLHNSTNQGEITISLIRFSKASNTNLTRRVDLDLQGPLFTFDGTIYSGDSTYPGTLPKIMLTAANTTDPVTVRIPKIFEGNSAIESAGNNITIEYY